MKRKNLINRMFICVLLLLSSAGISRLDSAPEFREFSRDRDTFERYRMEAEESMSAQEWQNILEAGREEMTALWERNALAECERYIREGYDPSGVRLTMEEARAGWENDFNNAMLYEKGRWEARQDVPGYTTGNMSGLSEKVNQANSAGLADTAAWENFVAGAVSGTGEMWESRYQPEIDALYLKAEILSGAEKEGFLAEARRIEAELKNSFDAEKDTILYLGKSEFIEKKKADSVTLKEKSEEKSASVIAGDIISETESEIRNEEERILDRQYSAEDGTNIDFSGLGDDWLDDLKELVDYGLAKWEAARLRLYNETISWKKIAEDAFETAEAKWRDGLKKIEAARSAWEIQLTAEIYKGLEDWEAGSEELSANISRSRNEFADYMKSMSGQWSDTNSSLVDMAVNGSKVYAEAVENIKWLDGMVASVPESGRYAFSSYDQAVPYIDDSVKNRIAEAKAEAERDFQVNYIEKFQNDPGYAGLYKTIKYTQIFDLLLIPVTTAYSSERQSVTESYKISLMSRIYLSVDPSNELYWYFKNNPSEVSSSTSVFTWDNVVTQDSDQSRRSSYCSYVLERERWKRISESFSTIAGDAEFYMHNENMTGDAADSNSNGITGSGYLTNAEGTYGVNDSGESADPYLMTQDEYNLELAERDVQFWKARLDIARSVLDYAEGRISGTAAETVQNKEDAEAAMENSKLAYNNALAAVNEILARLRLIQGLKPASGNSVTWEQYNSSIENLSSEYREAQGVLNEAEEKYRAAKTALIIYRNLTSQEGDVRPVEYIKREIEEIERNLLEAEKEANEKRTRLYIKQNEADYSGRTASYAALYSGAVKGYEQAKDRLDKFRSIASGPESEADVNAWVNGITGSVTELFGSDPDGCAGRLTSLVSEYNSSPDAEKREKVMREIRKVYNMLIADAELKRNIIAILRDVDFNPDEFIRSEFTADHEVYAQYAAYSSLALDVLDTAFSKAESSGGMTYESIHAYLESMLADKRYIYGMENRDYIIHYTALKYFEERYRGLTPDTWGYYRQRLASDSEYSHSACGVHKDMASGEASVILLEMEQRASSGDPEAALWLREYYSASSGIPGLSYIMECDSRAEAAEYVNSVLKDYAAENRLFFYSMEKQQDEHGYMAELYAFIKSAGLGEGTYANPFSIEAFSNMTPEEIGNTASMLQDYVDNLELRGLTVPCAIRKAAEDIAVIYESLDTKIFILNYMKNLIPGTTEEILSAASDTAEITRSAYDFFNECGAAIESGGSDLSIAENIIYAYERMGEAVKNYIAESPDPDIQKISSFVADIYAGMWNARLASYEKTYLSSGADVPPAQYAEMLPVEMRQTFINQMTPAYERARYNSAVESGDVSSIESYMAALWESGRLDESTAAGLKAYALIEEYTAGESAGWSHCDPAFSTYAGYRKFEDFIRTKGNNLERIDEYAAAYLSDNNITDPVIKETLCEFAADYYDGHISSFAYLPHDVKIYIAEQLVYQVIFQEGGNIADMGTFLEEQFGADSITGGLVEAAEQYAGRINAVTFYMRDAASYIKTLDEDTAVYFQMYIYGEGDAVKPGFEYGIYGDGGLINGRYLMAEGAIGRVLDSISSGYGACMTALEKHDRMSQRDLRRARGLAGFMVSGVQEKNWRDSAFSITGAETGENGVQTGTVVMTMIPVTGSGWIDVYDSLTGMRTVTKYSPATVERDGRTYSENGIIDDVNRIAAIFSTLGKACGTRTENNSTIASFLEGADSVYAFGSDYSVSPGGEYGFEAGMRSLVSGIDAKNQAVLAEAEDLDSGLASVESVLGSGRESIVSRKGVLDRLGGKDEAVLMAELEEAGRAHSEAEKASMAVKELLDTARRDYEAVNSEYIEAMNRISTCYDEYKASEFIYEKAYSVWEYANTPYLREMSSHDSGLGSAAAVDGSGNTDYSELDMPDARDNYERILTKYHEAQLEYSRRLDARNSQDNVEKLNADAEYSGYKNKFVSESETYIRISQTDAVLNERTAVFKTTYEQTGQVYEAARNSLPFFSELAGDEKNNSELVRERDIILSHIKTESDINNYMNGLLWFNCARVLPGIEQYITDTLGNTYENPEYRYRADEAAKYNNLPGQVKSDIEKIYALFGNSRSVRAIYDNYAFYAYARGMYEHYRHRRRNTSSVRFITKARYRDQEKRWDRKQSSAYGAYGSFYEEIQKSLTEIVQTRNAYTAASEKYKSAVSVRTLADVKAYLGASGGYNLQGSDMDNLYDSTAAQVSGLEGLNTDPLRREEQRRDIDGFSVKALYRNGEVIVLDKENNKTAEIYSSTDPWIILKTGGEAVTSFKEGIVYDFYDNNYDITVVTGIMKSKSAQLRAGYRADLMGYIQQSTAAGARDYTVILRDLENTYFRLKDTAVNFNNADEIRQRSFDGYTVIMAEYAYNSDNDSVQQLIMKEYIRQNRLYQEQQWKHQQEKYSQRRERWEQVTGYILNRGMRDWNIMTNSYLARWRKWSIETRKEIADGEKWWTDRDLEMLNTMNTWAADTSKAAGREAAQKIYEDLETTVTVCEKRIREKIPDDEWITIDSDGIVNDALKSTPSNTMGILNSSMLFTDRVAGMSGIFGFGTCNALMAAGRQRQEEYENAFGIMRNLQVLDVLNAIIENFNRQLAEANGNVYDGVNWNLRYSENFSDGDFQRDRKENRWSIRVCVESNLTGDRFKTKRFTDYVNMPNNTVFLTPIKGLNGKIDFTKADTYLSLEPEELDVYVGLETEKLNSEIDRIFDSNGTFSTYVNGEYERLGQLFGKYYAEWQAGEAMRDAGFYAKPIFPNGPNLMNVGVMVAGIAGGPWAGFAAQMLSTGIQVADNSMDLEAAAFSIGTSALTAGIGVGADYLGGMAGSGLAGAVVENSTKAFGTTLASGWTYDSENGFGWDGKSMGSWHIWVGAGVTAFAGSMADGIGFTDFSKALVNGTGGAISGGITTGKWGESFRNAAITAAGDYTGDKLERGISGGLGVQGNTYTTTLINNYTTFGMRKVFGSDEEFDMNVTGNVDTVKLVIEDLYSGYQIKRKDDEEARRKQQEKLEKDAVAIEQNSRKKALEAEYGKKEGNAKYEEGLKLGSALEKERSNEAERDRFKDPFAPLDDAVGGMFLTLGGIIGQGTKEVLDAIKNGASSVWGGIKKYTGSFVENTANLFRHGSFASDEEIRKENEQRKKEQQKNTDDLSGRISNIKTDQKEVNETENIVKEKTATDRKDYSAAKVTVDGKEIIVNKNGVNNGGKGFNQYNVDLPNAHNLCIFSSINIAAEIVSDKELLSIINTFQKANPKYVDGKMNVLSYQGITNSAGAIDVAIDERGTWVDKNTGSVGTDRVVDNATGVQEMVNVLDNKGAIVARFNGHTVTFNGYTFDKNGKLIFTVIDTGKNQNTFYDPESRQMFKIVQNEKEYDRAKGKNRYFQNYRRVQKEASKRGV